MPSRLYEAPLEHMGFALKSAVSSMPLQYGNYKVAIRYHHNMLVEGMSGDFIPNIHLTISADGNSDLYLAVPHEFLFVKCAFTEMETHAREKLKILIKDHPDMLAVVMVKITKVQHPLPALGSGIMNAHIGELPSKNKWLPLPHADNILLADYKGIALLDFELVSVVAWLRDMNAD